MSKIYSAGIVTAYGAAKRAGYQGTYEDFCRQQAGYAESAATVEQAKNTAVSAASTATAKAGEAATASTAAQTAKTQTEAAASQALTDISTARSGAISAVQTEGQTQTANARAQAQAAAQSATTASTKASEASASATTATTKATEAAASATSAAQSASNAQDVLESIPADYSALSEDVVQLKADLDSLEDCFETEEHSSLNLLDASKIETGCYYWTNGRNASGSYNATPFIPVEEGQTIYLQTGYESASSRSNKTMRFVAGYDSNKTVINSACLGSVDSYTVPNGVSFIIVSVIFNILTAAQNPTLLVSETGEVLDYIQYFEPYTTKKLKSVYDSPQTEQNTSDIESIRQQMVAANSEKAIFTATADTLNANANLICCQSCDNKKNEYIELTANFDTFGELTIAHGKDAFMGGYITITATKIIVYSYNGTQYEEFTHGLTLSDFINVIIYTKNTHTCRSSITVMTAGGDYTAETTRYYSCRAAVLCNANFAMTNVKMQYIVNDAKEDVWVFGDSYLSLGDPNRWAHQMIMAEHKNLLLCGYGGAKSVNEIVSFRNLAAVVKPKFVVWTLGMNDGDSSSAINADWKTYVDEVIATCEEKGVTPILATIPNVPNIIHTFKNAYVRSSGCRYVDFAKAVNAESAGASWYTGMLATDNTHPTALGAKALMRQFLLDVPEVLYAEE